MQATALLHVSAKVRRDALGVLDHAANDESTEVFRAALSDPVPRVRLVALHGLSCERCRIGELRVDDVMTDVLRVLREDASARVRHASIDVLCRFSRRDDRVLPALRAAALTDADPFVRVAAAGAARGEQKVWSRKAVRRRQCADAGAGSRVVVRQRGPRAHGDRTHRRSGRAPPLTQLT
jgi:hypothetical protein